MNRNVAHKMGDCEILNIYDKVINERIYFKTLSICTDTTTNSQYGHAAI